jgi:uncharacterized RDD family membrane protein YckC
VQRAGRRLTSAVAAAESTADSAAREPASLLRRLLAFVYDTLVLIAVLMSCTMLVVLLRGLRAVDPGTGWFEALLVGVAALFYGWFWTHGGQTVGMRAWRIRVVGRNGAPVGWRTALVRFAAAWLSALPLGLGLWWVLVDPERRAWHDRLSGTAVVRVSEFARTRRA